MFAIRQTLSRPRCKGFSMFKYVLISLVLLIFLVGAYVVVKTFLQYTQRVAQHVSENLSENAKE